MANRRFILGVVLVLAIVLVVAGAAAYYVTRPPPGSGTPPVTSTCIGTKTYSGSVVNTTGAAVPGAVVSLAAIPPNAGTFANTTTDANGSWSASVSGVCGYNARVFWQSAVKSPLLAQRVNVTATSSIFVNVSWENVSVNLLYEFPHSASANVSNSIPDGFAFFVEANSSGSIPLGFLPQDAAGSPGTFFSENGTMTETGTLPWVLYRPAARAYKVVDVNGNSVVYAVPRLQALFSSMSATDPLTMTAAIARVQARGGNPYYQVAAHGGETVPLTITNATHLYTAQTDGVFEVSLLTFVTVRTNSTLQLGLSVTIANSTNRTQCYVIDAEGAQIHTWFYGSGTCP